MLAWRRTNDATAAAELAKKPPAAKAAGETQDEEPIATALAIDDVKIELGYGLLSLINDLEGRPPHRPDPRPAPDPGRRLRLRHAAGAHPRQHAPGQPGVRIRIKEMDSGSGEVRLGSLLAMDPRGAEVGIPGEHVREPAFGLPATWIDEGLREEATFRGYTIVDPATVLTTHLTEILKDNMADLLSYSELQKLLKDLPAEQKKLVEDLIPAVVSNTTLQRVLQALLRERVSIRDLPTILEGHRRGRFLQPHRGPDRRACEKPPVAPAVLGPTRATTAPWPSSPCRPNGRPASPTPWSARATNRQLALAPSRLQEFIKGVRETFERASAVGDNPVLLTGPTIRPYVRSITLPPQTVVMSQNEVHPKARLKTVGVV